MVESIDSCLTRAPFWLNPLILVSLYGCVLHCQLVKETDNFFTVWSLYPKLMKFSRLFRLKQEQCTTLDWQDWHFGHQISTYFETPDGEEARKLQARTPCSQVNMDQVMLEDCNKGMMAMQMDLRLLHAVNITQPMMWITGKGLIVTTLMPW